MPEMSGSADSYDAMMEKMHKGASSNMSIIECSHLGERNLDVDAVVEDDMRNGFAKKNGIPLPCKKIVK
jgi:hypothetical protein